jgi:hypothetical protein
MGNIRISYGDSRIGEKGFETKVKDLILQFSAVNICEIGGGSHPALIILLSSQY